MFTHSTLLLYSFREKNGSSEKNLSPSCSLSNTAVKKSYMNKTVIIGKIVVIKKKLIILYKNKIKPYFTSSSSITNSTLKNLKFSQRILSSLSSALAEKLQFSSHL